MKMQKSEVRSQNEATEQPFGINYQWADSKGRLHLGRSVGTGRDRAHAERRFFRQHRHVWAEAGSVDVIPLVFMTIVLILILGILVIQIGRRSSQLDEANQKIEHLQFEVRTLTKTVGEVRAESTNAAQTNLTATGGAQ